MSVIFVERDVKKSFAAYPLVKNGRKSCEICHFILESHALFIMKCAVL